MLAVVSVDAGEVIRPVDTQLLGVNLTSPDVNLNTSETQQMVQAAGLTSFRLPGGSQSDDFHFNARRLIPRGGTDSSMASFIASVNGNAMVTLDYGSGSPQEAAAFLAYLNAPVGNTTAIGNGQEWNDSTNAWQTVNWQTAGYWASLRAAPRSRKTTGSTSSASTIPPRSGSSTARSATRNTGAGKSTTTPRSTTRRPTLRLPSSSPTYAARSTRRSRSASTSAARASDYNNWTADILQQSAIAGLHARVLERPQLRAGPGERKRLEPLARHDHRHRSDPSDPGDPFDWAVRAADYESLLTEYLGAAGNNVQLLATEFNSVYSNPGKQTTSLVNGLLAGRLAGRAARDTL